MSQKWACNRRRHEAPPWGPKRSRCGSDLWRTGTESSAEATRVMIRPTPHTCICQECPMYRALCLAFALVAGSPAVAADANPEPSIQQLQAKMSSGQVSSETLVRHYLERINALNLQGPALHAIISINAYALAQAHALAQERRERGARGPLHGIPVLLKDNIESADRMPTTAGSLALAENFAAPDGGRGAGLRGGGAGVFGEHHIGGG